MFLDYYRLRVPPFGAVTSPSQLYPSQTHCDALEALTDVVLADRGHLLLIGESGTGKTTLLGQVLEGLRENERATFVFTPDCTTRDILQSLLAELGFDSTDMEVEAMRTKLKQIWFAEVLAGKRFVCFFDNAQDLDDSVFEILQELARFETSNSRLFQFLLCGRPELAETLQRENLAPLRKRMVECRTLEPLSSAEAAGYIEHRLKAAGYQGEPLFDAEGMAFIVERSAGIPQIINKRCSRAMLEAYARGMRRVTREVAEKAEQNLNAPGVGRPEALVRDSEEQAPTAELTYRTGRRYKLTQSALRVGAAVAFLFTAGLALPHGIFRGVAHMMHDSVPAANPAEAQTKLKGAGSVAAAANVAPSPSVADKSTSSADAAKIGIGSILAETGSLTRELGLKINRIVIDAGHGGSDIGAKGPHGLLEKDVCLDVALRLGHMIEEHIPGAEVVYTRKDDSYVPLEERTAIANNAGADLFISIHANSSDSSEVRGVETYYLSLASSKEARELAVRENALTQSSLHDLPDLVEKITRNEKKTESKQLAEAIQGELAQHLQLVSRHERNRGVKQAPFIVLTGANMPAVLSEISFVSNAADENLLLGSGQRQRIAEGLYRGIASYLDGLHTLPQSRPQPMLETGQKDVSGAEPSIAQNLRNSLQQNEKLR